MSSFLSRMEERSSGFIVSPQFPALLQSVQLQFLSGCFALGTQIIASGANYEMQHYMVHLVISLSQCLGRCLWKLERKKEREFHSYQIDWGEWQNCIFLYNNRLLYDLLSYPPFFNPVWYSFGFYGYAKRAAVRSPHVLPAGCACAQTETPVGERTSRYFQEFHYNQEWFHDGLSWLKVTKINTYWGHTVTDTLIQQHR